jgi:hypothetical protein
VQAKPALLRLLTVMLLLQWGTALGQCLRIATPAEFHIDLCTGEGIQRLAIPLDAPAPAHASGGVCPACAGPGAVALPAPAAMIAPPLVFVQATETPPRPSTPVPAPPPRCQPRAPPTS